MKEIDKNPDIFSVDDIEWPPSFQSNAIRRAKVMKVLQKYAWMHLGTKWTSEAPEGFEIPAPSFGCIAKEEPRVAVRVAEPFLFQ